MIDKVHDTYSSELDGKKFAYDGEKSLFTVDALSNNKLEFTIVLEDVTSNKNKGNASPDGHDSPNEHDKKRLKRPYQSKTFKVEINFVAKIPILVQLWILLSNQNVKTPTNLDRNKAKKMLKNLRIRVSPSNQVYKVTGLIDQLCRDQLFSLKHKIMENENGEVETLDIIVHDYFVNHRNIQL
ncbi:hypothetical protein REPUB_Repub10bG0048000 [Reevesia pubescens]